MHVESPSLSVRFSFVSRVVWTCRFCDVSPTCSLRRTCWTDAWPRCLFCVKAMHRELDVRRWVACVDEPAHAICDAGERRRMKPIRHAHALLWWTYGTSLLRRRVDGVISHVVGSGNINQPCVNTTLGGRRSASLGNLCFSQRVVEQNGTIDRGARNFFSRGARLGMNRATRFGWLIALC